MKIIILIALLFICGIFIGFNHSTSDNNTSINDSKRKKFDEYFTKYNPEFVSKGLMKSSFKHELIFSH
ncbi:MAG: hypothetical protein JST55_09880 [Bacteroidetes bacterium]|nr:hypothetical protein [Bacteroidota bacterium]